MLHLRARRTARQLVAATLVAGALAALPILPSSAGAALVRPHALSPGASPPGSSALGAVPATQELTLSVAVPPANQPALASLLHDLYDPASPEYHHWLAPGQFRSEFGPSAGDLARVTSWLRSDGFSPSVTGYLVKFDAPEAKVAHAFGTTFERYRVPGGANGYVASSAPLVPSDLATGQIQSILGLNTTYRFNPQLAAAPSSPAGATPQAANPMADGLSPCSAAKTQAGSSNLLLNQEGADYGVGTLLGAGQNGSGETVALYELAPTTDSDVGTYESCFGLTNSLAVQKVDTGGTVNSNGTAEADLDAEQVMTQAQGASVVSYEGPNTVSGAYDVWNAIVTAATPAPVVTTSWGMCEPDAVTAGEQGAYTTLFEQAAAQGQSVFSASGDQGTEGCYASDGTTGAQVTYPASDPWVTAVGGTTLTGNSVTSQTAWNWCQSNESKSCANSHNDGGAGGGGMSRYEATSPPSQPRVLTWGTTQPCGTHCREVPDVSANAGTGMVVYDSGWTLLAGTSFASPFMAGLVADMDSGCGTIGDLTSRLYSLNAAGSYGTAFDDVTTGDIDLTGSQGHQYAASTGYDAATGIGTPLAAGLTCTSVTSVSPSSTFAGAQVTVNGLGLEHATIDFGSAPATVVSATATSATVVVPAGSGTVAVSATGNAGDASSTAPFTYSAPGPFSLTGATPGDTQVAVSWGAAAGATSYAVYDATSSGSENTGGTPACTATAPSLTCTVSGLSNGTQYFFVVVASNAGGTTQSANELSATPELTAPGAFSLSAATAGDTQVAVSWGASNEATSYAVYDATSPGAENTSGTPACSAAAPTLTCTVSGLTDGTTYYFVVVATGPGGTTQSANELHATPEPPAPGAFGLSSATAGNAQVAVSWGASANTTSYAVYDATTSGAENTAGTPACTVAAPTLTCTASGLTDGTTYYFVVVATGPGGTTQSANELHATPEPPAPGTFSLSAATAGNARVAVGWGAASNASSYAVYDAISPGAENTGGTPACTATAPTLTCTVSGLSIGTTYYFVVVARDSSGTTRSANELHATPSAPPPPPPPARHGYWLVGSDGGIFTFGAAQFYGSTGSLQLQRPVVGIVPTKDDGGYWLDASDGGVFSFGDTQFYGSVPGLGLHPAGSGLSDSLNAPIVGMVPSNDDGGYFMVASDGGVFAFGDARFAGSCPGIGGCSGAAVAVMPDASGNGYWLVTQTGSVYTFGDAHYYGAPGNTGSPVTSAVRTPDGRGYWVLTANGTVYNYGDAGNFGGPAGQFGGLNPASAIFTTADGGGYWVAAGNGAVLNYGDAPNDGSMAGTSLNGSIIAATGW